MNNLCTSKTTFHHFSSSFIFMFNLPFRFVNPCATEGCATLWCRMAVCIALDGRQRCTKTPPSMSPRQLNVGPPISVFEQRSEHLPPACVKVMVASCTVSIGYWQIEQIAAGLFVLWDPLGECFSFWGFECFENRCGSDFAHWDRPPDHIHSQ